MTSEPHADPAEPLSVYGIPAGEQLLDATGEEAPSLAARVHAALRAVILDPEFPCVGARSALNEESYRFALYPELATPDGTTALAHHLVRFVQEQSSLDGKYTTFIASFGGPKTIEPLEFEALLWRQLAMLHAVDIAPWDSSVSADPGAPTFSFSFAGRAFFVVGLCPTNDRWARRFPWPTLAFNAHFQFEEMRAAGRFTRMQEVVRERDRHLQGTVNPSLSNFGEHTEARQYSGRAVGPDWRCPVSFDVRTDGDAP